MRSTHKNPEDDRMVIPSGFFSFIDSPRLSNYDTGPDSGRVNWLASITLQLRKQHGVKY